MNTLSRLLFLIGCFLALDCQAQPVMRETLKGQFLTDSIEIGRPFQYALTYRHPTAKDALFPDTARHFAPYRVQKVVVFATQTTGAGASAISRDSAVYTLVSFAVDSVQLLRVPVRVLNEADCTALWTQIDTVFLRSKLPVSQPNQPRAYTMATDMKLAPLQQQFNYGVLAVGLLSITVLAGILYGLFGRPIRRQWRLYQLNQRHLRFLSDFNRLNRNINAYTAADTANQAVVLWKTYLEKLDPQPYTSMTTPEIAERMHDDRIMNALREADRMIYGGTFSEQSQSALRVLSDIATQAYHRRRDDLQVSARQSAKPLAQTDAANSDSFN
jgi:hypothetical protein